MVTNTVVLLWIAAGISVAWDYRRVIKDWLNGQ